MASLRVQRPRLDVPSLSEHKTRPSIASANCCLSVSSPRCRAARQRRGDRVQRAVRSFHPQGEGRQHSARQPPLAGHPSGPSPAARAQRHRISSLPPGSCFRPMRTKSLCGLFVPLVGRWRPGRPAAPRRAQPAPLFSLSGGWREGRPSRAGPCRPGPSDADVPREREAASLLLVLLEIIFRAVKMPH